MPELSHTGRGTRARRRRLPRARSFPRQRPSVHDVIITAERRLLRARVFFGHGTDNAWDEAAALVLHAVRFGQHAGPGVYRKRVSAEAERRARELLTRRIKERIPAVYLTGQTWFAGLPLYVDHRVLVPRSAIAELIERGFAPWVAPERVRRVLDLGTGSGCIAVACAKAFPRARVDAVDISTDALAVAQRNVRRHRVGKRVRLLQSDHFSTLGAATYDIIVSNPPYVGARELRALPPEYRHEPRIALASGRTGLDSVRVILREAARHLRPRGILVIEVGNTETAVRRAFPHVPFVWLEFERGGGGVFVLTAAQLQTHENGRCEA